MPQNWRVQNGAENVGMGVNVVVSFELIVNAQVTAGFIFRSLVYSLILTYDKFH